jgi:putative membrane protein
LILATLGTFALVINTLMLMLTSRIGRYFGIGLTVDGFWTALLGSLVISIVSVILSFFLRDELKGKRKKV